MAHFTININLKAIPRELIRRVGDNAYVDLNVYELRDIDERGNNLTVQVYIPKDKIQDYPNKIYIGRGRVWEDQPRPAQPAQAPAPQAPSAPVEEYTDLPF